MHTVQILNNLVGEYHTLAYLVIFLGLIFEGEVVVLTAGVLSQLGALNFWPSLVFIFAGGMVKTFGGYWLGTWFARRYKENHFLRALERRILYFMPNFRKKPFWSIFLSKFIMGVNYLVVVFSGYQKVNLKNYLRAEILSTLIWAPALLALGFFFSQTALSITKEIGKFSLIVVIFVAVFLLFDKLAATFYRVVQYIKSFSNGNGNREK